jgi:hypothetical protein
MLNQQNAHEARMTGFHAAAHACGLIRDCIDAVRWPAQSGPAPSQVPFPPKPRTSAEQFLFDVRAWLHAARRASGKGWHPDDAWLYAFKPHLALLVGPTAHTALGRAAGQEGHRMLALEFRVLFGRVVPPQAPTLLGLADESDEQRRDGELVATFQALPERLRLDERLATRLLGITLRIVTSRPERLDDEAAQTIAELQQLAVLRCAHSERSPLAPHPHGSDTNEVSTIVRRAHDEQRLPG